MEKQKEEIERYYVREAELAHRMRMAILIRLDSYETVGNPYAMACIEKIAGSKPGRFTPRPRFKTLDEALGYLKAMSDPKYLKDGYFAMDAFYQHTASHWLDEYGLKDLIGLDREEVRKYPYN